MAGKIEYEGIVEVDKSYNIVPRSSAMHRKHFVEIPEEEIYKNSNGETTCVARSWCQERSKVKITIEPLTKKKTNPSPQS